MIQPYYYYLERPDRIKEIDYEDLLIYMEDRPAWSEIKLLAALKQKYTYGSIDQELIHHLISTTNDKNMLNRYLSIIESFPSKPEFSSESDTKTITLDLESMSDVTEVSVDDNIADTTEDSKESIKLTAPIVQDIEDSETEKGITDGIGVNDAQKDIVTENIESEEITSDHPDFEEDEIPPTEIESTSIENVEIESFEIEDPIVIGRGIENIETLDEEENDIASLPEDQDSCHFIDTEIEGSIAPEHEDYSDEYNVIDNKNLDVETTTSDELEVENNFIDEMDFTDEIKEYEDRTNLIAEEMGLTEDKIEDMQNDDMVNEDMETFDFEGEDQFISDQEIEGVSTESDDSIDSETDTTTNHHDDHNGVNKDYLVTNGYEAEFINPGEIEGFVYGIEHGNKSLNTSDEEASDHPNEVEEGIDQEAIVLPMVNRNDADDAEDIDDSQTDEIIDTEENDTVIWEADLPEVDSNTKTEIDLPSKTDEKDFEAATEPEKRKKTRFEKIAAKRREEIDQTDQDMVVDFKTWLSTLTANPETAKEWKVKKKKVKKAKLNRKKLSKAEKLAAESVQVNDEVVSETLAKLYVKQGLIDRAQAMYEKLSLKYPEKSIYFAAKLKELADKKS